MPSNGYSGLLRTLESAYGLSALGGAASVSPITDVWS
jgi:hypothetical protein